MSDKYTEFARTVETKLLGTHPASSQSLSRSSQLPATMAIPGLSPDEAALLFRLSGLKELPVRANYTTLPLGVEQVEGKVLTGGLRETALRQVDRYWDSYHPPITEESLLAPYNITLAINVAKLRRNQLEAEGVARLLALIDARIELDDGADRLAHHISSYASGPNKRPSIKRWTVAGADFSPRTMRELYDFFYDDVQAQLCPGWKTVLEHPSGFPQYSRPACFLACVAHTNGYETKAAVQPVVELFFRPRRAPSFPSSISLPCMGPTTNNGIEALTQSLSAATLVAS
ncbi:hypothetical protein C8J57DRAFT_211743 [Mycena rebaudengoi]|nr:hypothetical protein C8J57DRAFT_211743 [Mycena rebaudengoi]